MTRAERAVALHDGGSACSQAVFAVFSSLLGMPPAPAHRISAGFGGGMGRLGLTCGAMTGGVLALSLAFGNESGADQEAKVGTYRVVTDFMRGMEEFAGCIECRKLLGGVDLWTEDGLARMKAEKLSSRVCNRLIGESVSRVEKILVDAGKIAREPGLRAESPAGLDIHRATAGDAPTLADFLFRLLVEIMPPADWSHKRESLVAGALDYFTRGADSPDHCNLLATVDGVPAGCACMVVEERPPHLRYEGTRFGYMHNVFVAPEFRGRGIARGMVERLHGEAKAMGIVRIGLHASRYGRPIYVASGYESVERYMENEGFRPA